MRRRTISRYGLRRAKPLTEKCFQRQRVARDDVSRCMRVVRTRRALVISRQAFAHAFSRIFAACPFARACFWAAATTRFRARACLASSRTYAATHRAHSSRDLRVPRAAPSPRRSRSDRRSRFERALNASRCVGVMARILRWYVARLRSRVRRTSALRCAGESRASRRARDSCMRRLVAERSLGDIAAIGRRFPATRCCKPAFGSPHFQLDPRLGKYRSVAPHACSPRVKYPTPVAVVTSPPSLRRSSRTHAPTSCLCNDDV